MSSVRWFKYILVNLFIIISTNQAIADPKPFGVEINNATIDEVKQRYQIISTKPNKIKGYMDNIINPKSVNSSELQAFKITTDSQNIVRAIEIVIAGSNFDKLLQSLSSKYKLLTKMPSQAWFSDGKTQITFQYNNKYALISYEQDQYKALSEEKAVENIPKDMF